MGNKVDEWKKNLASIETEHNKGLRSTILTHLSLFSLYIHSLLNTHSLCTHTHFTHSHIDCSFLLRLTLQYHDSIDVLCRIEASKYNLQVIITLPYAQLHTEGDAH